MSDVLDKAGKVREGEELDAGKLEAWLREALPDHAGALSVEQFRKGYSNLTYAISIGETQLVLRRPPFGNQTKTGHDMSREYRVLSRLPNAYPPAPRALAYCEDESVLGAPFYVMERRHGMIIRRELPKGLSPEPEQIRGLCETLVDNLVDLHAVDYAAVGLGELGKPEGYVQRQVEGWTRRFGKARTDDVPDLLDVSGWIADNLPADRGPALIHNDYKFDNLVLDPEDPSRIVAVLDWEMATVGDPLMDLGTTLGYWVQADDPPECKLLAFGPTHLPGSMTRREIVERYAQRSGREVPNPVFYWVFGLYKIAGIVQQIYYRYKNGYTKDPRFAPLGHFVGLLGKLAGQAAERGEL